MIKIDFFHKETLELKEHLVKALEFLDNGKELIDNISRSKINQFYQINFNKNEGYFNQFRKRMEKKLKFIEAKLLIIQELKLEVKKNGRNI